MKNIIRDPECGVPQDSVLSLSTFINDKATPIFKDVLFADNTNMFHSNDTVEKVCIATNKPEINQKWFNINKL